MCFIHKFYLHSFLFLVGLLTDYSFYSYYSYIFIFLESMLTDYSFYSYYFYIFRVYVDRLFFLFLLFLYF